MNQSAPFPSNERSAFQPLAVLGSQWGGFVLNQTSVGLTRMKRSPRLPRGLPEPFNPKLERYIRVNPTVVELIRKKPSLGPQNGKWLKRASFNGARLLLPRETGSHPITAFSVLLFVRTSLYICIYIYWDLYVYPRANAYIDHGYPYGSWPLPLLLCVMFARASVLSCVSLFLWLGLLSQRTRTNTCILRGGRVA